MAVRAHSDEADATRVALLTPPEAREGWARCVRVRLLEIDTADPAAYVLMWDAETGTSHPVTSPERERETRVAVANAARAGQLARHTLRMRIAPAVLAELAAGRGAEGVRVQEIPCGSGRGALQLTDDYDAAMDAAAERARENIRYWQASVDEFFGADEPADPWA